MGVCRFFLQGNCRYGTNCWSDHPAGGNQGFSTTAQRQLFGGGNKSGGGRGQNQVSFGQNRFKWISPDAPQHQQPQQQQQQNREGGGATQQLSTGDIVRALATEVQTMFEEGKMWPFTCLGFEKELPSLPGFSDISMEEMRIEAYEAQKSGNVQQFEQKFRSLVNGIVTQRQELKNPNMTLKQKLISFIDDAKKKKNSDSFGQTSLFSEPSTNSGFGGGNSGGLFGSSQSGSQSGSGLFASKESSSGFGQSGQSLFGQAPAFGQTSTFGQSVTSGQSSGGTLFGQSAGQTGMGQTSTLFGQQTTQPLPTFGQPQTPKANLFGKSSESPLKMSSFQTPSTTTQSFFGAQTSQNPAPVSNLFVGGAIVQSGFGFGTSTAAKPAVQAQPEDAYTAIDKLTADELKEFQSQTFTKVPLRPPPREFCF